MGKDIRRQHAVKGAAAAAGDRTGGNEYPVIVAGIGVGAGGTRSLKQLLGKIPSGMGIAYVLVLHPGPSKKILSIRQLRNLAPLEVVEATEGMPVLADRIHVMPTDRFLNITGGRLTLHEPVQCNGMWMPIDHFLCTLARDFRRRSCGIVLAGAGSDGTLGLSEIKASGGKTFAEKPGSAEFPEMPQSAIDAGVADAVLAAEAMAGAIAATAQQAQEEIRMNQASSQETHADLQDILNILRAKIGYDFSGYKPNTLVRRIRRRMALGKLASYADYAGFLNEHPDEIGLLQKDLLIGVTEFFRQPQAWEFLEEKIVASIVENAQPGSVIRVWVPGCSTGQEAYSLAMVLTEQVKKSGKKLGIQIFATDSDLSALATARSGSYSKEEIGGTVSAERLKRFFEHKEGRYQILKQIREQIVFAPQNLTSDPPFSRLDLISCRNLLMYLEQTVQQRITVLFHFALREGGFLFLGTAESTGDREDLFDPVSKKWRIYRRIGIGRPAGIEIPVCPTGETIPSTGPISAVAPVHRLTLASAAHQMLLDRFAPACVMIDRKLQVLYVHGKVEDYLTFPTGELTTRIVDMAREGLRARLRGAIGKCLETKRPVTVIGRVRRGEKSVPVKATVSPMRHPRETNGLLLVTFEDHRLPALKSGRQSARESDVQQLSDELKVTREELQSTIEQLESSNDQLKASNEEVTASNEELQSANEELETSKEELQSLNEELNTINARLQEKVGELEGTNNDVLNLLSSTAIATVFLDKELRVKRFTPASTRLLSLIASDQGRPVADVLRRFADEKLLDDARRVLTELTPLAKEVQADGGRWYFRRITPYRTQDDRIEGVVLTFVDVSDIKQAEQALRASEENYRDLVESANSVIIRWKPYGELTYFNRYGLSFFGYREEDILGRNVMTLIPDQESSGRDLSDLAKAIVEHPEQYINNENENVLADGSRVWVQWTNKAILDDAGNVREILAIGNDITERKHAEEELRLAHLRVSWLARFPEENPNPVLRVSAEGEALYCNPAAMELDGLKCEIGRPMPDPVLPLVRKAMAEGREVMQDVGLGERTYSVAVTSFPEEGYANVYGRDVTKRKQAEKELQTTMQRFYHVLSGMYAAVLLVMDDGRVEFANQAFCDIFRLKESPESLNGLESQEMIEKIKNGYQQPDEAVARIREIVRIGEPVKGEEVAMSGGRTCLRDFIPIVVNGISYGRLWHHLDITERKRAEEALRQSGERFRAFVTASSEVIYRMSPDWKEMRQLDGRDFLSDTLTSNRNWLQEYIHPDDQPHVLDVINESIRTKSIFELEHRVLRMDGTTGWTFSRAIPLLDENGEILEWFGAASDITERKRAEETLRESEARLNEVLNSITDGYYALDREWRFVELNPVTERHFGYPAEELKGRNIWKLRKMPPDAPVYQQFYRAVREHLPVHFEAESRINPGAWSELHLYPREGRLDVYFRDITVRKRAEEERERLLAETQKAEKRIAADLDAMNRLQKLGSLFLKDGNMETVLHEIVDAAIAISGADFGNIQLLDSQSGDLKIVAHQNFPEWWIAFWSTVAEGKGVCGTALERGERIIVEDVKQSPIFVGTPALEIQLKAGVRAVQSTPLVSRTGRVLGMFSTHYKKPYRPEERTLRLLDLLARHASDIIENAQSQDALRQSEQRFRLALHNAPVSVAVQDRDLRYVWAYNQRTARPEEIVGKLDADIFTPEEAARLEAIKRRVLEENVEIREQMWLNRPSGRIFLDVYWEPIRDEAGRVTGVGSATVDLTPMKIVEEELNEAKESLEQRVRERTMDLQNLAEQLEGSRHELRKLASELVMAEERERKRIAGVLHDDIAQILAAARMRLDMLEDLPSDQEHKVKEAKALLVESLQETRTLMNDLGNPVLFDLGLQAACESLANRLMEGSPVRIRCDIQDAFKELNTNLKTLLYQVVRELLNNIAKHSQAQNAQVRIDLENGHFRVQVADDGVGFNPRMRGAPTVEGGFGLYSIRERLIAINGSLNIESTPGAGTVVTAILPETLD